MINDKTRERHLRIIVPSTLILIYPLKCIDVEGLYSFYKSQPDPCYNTYLGFV